MKVLKSPLAKPRGRIWDTVGSAAVALVLAIVVWVNAVYETDPPTQDAFPQPIPIEIVNMADGMVISNAPAQQVSIQIKAFRSSWDSLTAESFRATVDLDGLAEGLHTIPVEVTCTNPTVTIVTTQPDSVFVQVEPLFRSEYAVELRLENEADLPLGYALTSPVFTPSTAVVEGPASLVKTVQNVVVALNVAGRRGSVDQNLPLRVLDATGKQVTGITVTPSAVRTELRIEQRQNYREVAVLARTSGQPARGYYVSSIAIDPATVTVVGAPSVIATMPGIVSIEGDIDVTGATRLIAQRAELDLPDGVSVYTDGSSDSRQVLVTVDIDAFMGGATLEVPLKARKLRDGYTVSLSVPSVDVILTGPSVVLDELAADLVDAYVDLTGLESGVHQLKVVVELLAQQDPQLADLVVTSVSPAFVEADIRGAGGTAGLPVPTPAP